ncbi:Peptidase C54 [Penicillium expansum]|nr:Peptidase C54 [Penicillium expansum]
MTVDMEKCKRIVQYFWDPEPRNDVPAASIWCLGREYAPPQPPSDRDINNPYSPSRQPDASTLNDTAWPKAFLSDFGSRIWITYRSNFTPIPRTKSLEATSSMTLGVRLRSQLMDPQGFTVGLHDQIWTKPFGKYLFSSITRTRLAPREKVEEESKLISMFADHPEAPFSIHQFVNRGAESCGKYPGEWFGPSATAKCIQLLSTQSKAPQLRVYVTNDTSDIYEDKFAHVSHDRSGHIQPTLILIGTRLGIDNVTPAYWDGLRAALTYPQSVGIAGGRPSASHYFVGAQDCHLFFLDPHTTRPATSYRPDGLYTQEELDSYYTNRLRRIHIKDMDPSMLIGFLIQDEDDWADWKKRIQSTPGQPIVHIFPSQHQPDYGHGRAEALDEVEALDDSDEME